MEIDDVTTQDMMRSVIFLVKLRMRKDCLIKDYSSLSKAFSKSILRSILPNFPFDFLKE